MLACVFHDFIRAQWVHVSLELNFTFECTHEVSSWQFNHETRPWGHENKQNMWNVSGIITIKIGTHNVGNICLANRPNEAVLLTRVYSFEIHPSDLFQFTSRDTAQSYGWTWWPLQSLKGKPSTREITNRSPCVIRNSASSVHHPPLGLHMLQPAHSTQIMLVPAGCTGNEANKKSNAVVTAVKYRIDYLDSRECGFKSHQFCIITAPWSTTSVCSSVLWFRTHFAYCIRIINDTRWWI
jgi:hypothetical protein